MAKYAWSNQKLRGVLIQNIIAEITVSVPFHKQPKIKKAAGMAAVALNRYITNASPEILQSLVPEDLIKKGGDSPEFMALKNAVLTLTRTK